MTLADLLATRIARTGPMTIADYMAEALLHPQFGYYATRDPFGAAGDFITAPEISQMFGEMVGLCLAQSWLDQGRPRATLAEIGPGRGTLMADILRATSAVPGFHDSITVCLIEASAKLRGIQTTRVPQARHLDSVDQLPEAPLFLVANEFLDALPVRQFVRSGNGWRERMVGLDGDSLTLGLSAAAPLAMLEHRIADTAEGDLVELCPALPAVVGTVADRIAHHGGAALFIDYGHWRSKGDTLQALRAHKTVDPLDGPGTADLTTHVDFEAIARAATGVGVSAMTAQGVFLERLGITARAKALATRMTGAALDQHIAAHRRLTHPAEMGDLFKVIGLYPSGLTPPPGLEP